MPFPGNPSDSHPRAGSDPGSPPSGEAPGRWFVDHSTATERSEAELSPATARRREASAGRSEATTGANSERQRAQNQCASADVTRTISAMVVVPSTIFVRPLMRSVFTPSRTISSFSSAVEQPWSTISLSRSVKGMTS